MTKQQIQKTIDDHPNAINLIPSSHRGDLPDLVEAHAEVFVISRSECVKNYDKDGSSWMPSAYAIGRLATLAGVSFHNSGNETRKDGPHCWVGNSQAYRMGPDGKNEDGPAAEKEFDADLQVEALRLRGKTAWKEVDGKNVKTSVPYTPEELNAQLAQFIVSGRERANTGARTRGILGLLGQPRAFKGLFSEKGNDSDTREILVSRIIWNTKNKMLAERMLDNLTGNVSALYGPKVATQAIAAPTAEPRRVGPGTGDDFDPTATQPPENPFRSALKEALEKHRADLGPKAISAFETALADEHTTDQVFATFLKQTKDFLASKGIDLVVNMGGAA